jgi:hypothetical protein
METTMGFDVYGRNPSTAEGEYFRRNIWYWGPLADLCISVAPKECSPCEEWHSNNGDGLNARQAILLADALDRALADGTVRRYILALRSRPDKDRREGRADDRKDGFRAWIAGVKEAANFCDDVSEEDVREFVVFLRGSGGFIIS